MSELFTNEHLAHRLREFLAVETDSEYENCGACLMDHAEQVLTALTAAADVERMRGENEDQARRLKRLREIATDFPLMLGRVPLFTADEIRDLLNIET